MSHQRVVFRARFAKEQSTINMRCAILILLLSLSFPACQQGSVEENFTPRFVLSDQPPVKVNGDKTPYTFGYLEVPENRQQASSRMIRLPVYIFKSRSKQPALDPVLYTVGGPGESSLGAAPYMKAFEYLEDRDLILFEQRGTTHAEPNLACPEWTEVTARLAGGEYSTTDSNAAYVEAAIRCRNRLLVQKTDLDGYNTREIAADIEDLRRALGIDQLNLLTISYSTKIAQTMMREYPQSLRSVVMDSPLPLAVNYAESTLTNLVETYQSLFADCANAPDCNAKHPKLSARFFKYLEQISENPLQLQISGQSGKDSLNVKIRGADVAAYLADIKTAETKGFPALLEALMAGDETIIRDNFYRASPGPGNGLGMRLSVWCSEEFPFSDPDEVARERERYPFLMGMSPTVFSYEVCRAWKVRPAPATENEAILSSVPTLLISGSYDAVTPAKWAARLNQELENSHHLVFPGWAHGPTTYWDDPCAMQAANAFFNQPNTAPALACLDTLTVPEFE